MKGSLHQPKTQTRNLLYTVIVREWLRSAIITVDLDLKDFNHTPCITKEDLVVAHKICPWISLKLQKALTSPLGGGSGFYLKQMYKTYHFTFWHFGLGSKFTCFLHLWHDKSLLKTVMPSRKTSNLTQFPNLKPISVLWWIITDRI